ncbi:MAG: C40 family peptidase [Microbacteriaceae bacterium]
MNNALHTLRRLALRAGRMIRRSATAVASGTSRLATTLRSDGARRVGVMTVATSLVGAFSLPAFGLTQSAIDYSRGDGQSVVAADAGHGVQKDNFAELSAAQIARQGLNINYPKYSGPSVADLLQNPPYANGYDLAAVFAIAKKYQGVPYRYGGASPAGFDCSGYIQFVYAQFGVSLPHSVSGQGVSGRPISINDAQPGDIVMMAGHNGFYAGNGMILDAPRAGGSVSIRPIWTSDYYIIRLGI